MNLMTNRADRPRTRSLRRLALTGGAIVAAVALAGCSSSGPATPTESASAPTDDLVATAQAIVEDAMLPTTEYDVPTEAIDGASLEGETIYYIPITIQAESFQIVSKAMTEAVAPLGISIQVCDGGASPDKAAACVNEATGAGAAAIIADAIPYGLAANAFDGAKAAGIPILISNQHAPDGYVNDSTLAYSQGNPVTMAETASYWLIADSDGEAYTVINEYTDSPDTQGYIDDHALPILEDCAGCTTVVNPISSANFALIPSSTSSILLKNPDADYFYQQYDTGLQPAMAGIQQAGRLEDIRGISTNGLLGAIKLVQQGQFLYADVASDYNFAAYSLADVAMRMILDADIPEDVTVPIRVITRDNVDEIGPITPEAAQSGEWFGETTYKKDFATLWGAAS